MTFEEIQKTIEGMLAVQRELQEGQLKIQESQIQDRERIDRISTTLEQMLAVQRELQESQIQDRERIERLLTVIERLIEISNRHEGRIEQLIGYSISGESDRLNILQRIMTLENRIKKLENGQDN